MKKTNESEDRMHYMPIFMSIGISLGVAIGAATDNIPIGMCIGLGTGMCVGSLIDLINRKKTCDSRRDGGEESED